MEGSDSKKTLPPAYIIAVLAIGVFMAMLDATIFVPALNSVVSEFQTSFEWVTWTVTIYMLAFTVTMPLAGKIADLYGRKRLYIAGVGIFCIGSLACGLAWDMDSLIAFRVLQAIGGGMIMPAAMSEVTSAVPEKSRGMAMGIIMAVNAVAGIVGPNLGGFLVEHFGWRYVFYINPPIGIVAILLALKFTESFGSEKHSIDIVGAGLLGGSLLAFMYGVIQAGTLSLTDISVWALFVLSAIFAVALVLWERRAREPIISIPLMARGDVLALNLAALAFGVGFFSLVLYVSSYAQSILGLGVQDSGTILTPMTLSVLVMAIVGGKLMDKYGIKPIIFIGSLIMCASLFAMAYWVSDATSLAITLLFAGVGVGFSMGSFQTLIMTMAPARLKGSASGITQVFMNMGGILGPTIGSFFMVEASKKIADFAASMAGSEMPQTGGMTGGMDVKAMMAQAVKDAMAPAFHNIYTIAAFASVAMVILIGYIVVRDYIRKPVSPPEIKT